MFLVFRLNLALIAMDRLKVMIVEDEWIVSEEIKLLVEQCNGCVVGQSDNAEEALEILRAHQPQLAILDIRLRGEMDGIDLAEEIRRSLVCDVVFLSSLNDKKTLERFRGIDPLMFIVKPFEVGNIREVMSMFAAH